MKKALVVLLILVCFAGVNQAQKKNMYIGGGLELALPQGDFGDAYTMGYGATATFEMAFSDQLHGIGTVGYIMWSADDDILGSSVDVTSGSIPVLAGVKYYFDKKGGFYVLGQAGFYFTSYEIEGTYLGYSYSSDGSDSDFALRAGGGYELAIGKTAMLDISAFYVVISDANSIGARVGAKFPL
jgi:hypothetical protein